MRPRRLKLRTHVDSGQMCRILESGYCFLFVLFVSSFFFLSNFQTLNVFVTLFSGIMRPRRMKLSTHVGRNRLLLFILFFISSFFFLSNFQTLKCFVTLFSETVRPRRLKLCTFVGVGSCIVYIGIKLLLLIRPFIFHFSFSQIFKQ